MLVDCGMDLAKLSWICASLASKTTYTHLTLVYDRLSDEQANEISDVLIKVRATLLLLFELQTSCPQRPSERVSSRSSIKPNTLLPLVRSGLEAPAATQRKRFGRDLTLPSVIVSVDLFQRLPMRSGRR